MTVTVTDNENPTVTASTDIVTTTSFDSTGNCTVSRAVPNAVNTDNCIVTKLTWVMTGVTTGNSLVTGINQVGTKVFNIGVTTITYTVTDGSGNTSNDFMTVTVTDDENPIITCLSDQNVNFGANCEFILPDYTSFAVASDNCSTPVITQNPATGTSISGQTTVTLTATDSANNISTCTFEVIPTDNEPPTAVCKKITVNLSPSGTVNINAIDIDNGSHDNCGIALRTVSPNSFNCGDVGDNIVTFTVYDDAGNSNSCTAIVTVVDNTSPIMQCNDFVVVVNPITRVATINASDVDNGSNDICGIASLIVSPSVFTEDPNGDVYTTTATLTAVDVNGNTSTCVVNVTIEPPVNQNTYLTGVIIDPVPTNPQPPSELIEATACPGGLYDPKDVEFTLDAIGTYNLQASDVLHWEYSEDNGEIWIVIPGTAGTLTYTLNNIIRNTFVRISIRNADDPLIIQSSATAFVRFLPPDEPPIIVSNSSLNICLGESVTVVAESFFDQPSGQFGEGGKFNSAQPDGWRVDGVDNNFPAANSSGAQGRWGEATDNGKAYSGIDYGSSDGTKRAIAHGYGNGYSTTLETPVFSTIGMTSAEAILSFSTSFYFCNAGYGEIELSFDSGNSYTQTLTTLEGLNFTSGNATSVILTTGAPGNAYMGTTNDIMVPATINLGQYVGLSGLRVKFTFYGGSTHCGDITKTTFPNPNNVNSNKTRTLASGWAIDDVGFVFSQVDDELEWTDENNTVIAIGTTATVTPVTPGIRRYGVTTLINGCRTDDDTGTSFIDINTSLAYAGEDYLPVLGNCGEAALKLNAYDNTKKALENYAKGAWKNNLYVVPANASEDFVGTGVKGEWFIVSSNVTSPSCGSSATFSANDDPDAVFTGNPGTYKLRWTLTNGCFDEIDVKISDCNSLDFDGGNDYVTFKNNYNLNSAFSIETWVKPNSVTGTQTVFSRKDADDNTSGYDLSIVNGQVRFNWYYSAGSGSVTSSTYLIDTSRWYHLAVTFDGATYKLYVDGIELGLVNNTNPPNLTGNNVEALLGAMYQLLPKEPKNYYHGWVDELKIWNKALSVEHIRQMMNQEIDALGTDVGGVVIPNKVYGPDNDDNGVEDNSLLWNNLEAYYKMTIGCGDMAPYKKGVNGRLRNITSSQEQSAPIPYTSTTNGMWDNKDTWNNKTIWTTKYVWDVPNSIGINGSVINWNIVQTSHDISVNREITLLGLISQSGEMTIEGITGADGTGTGQGLWITHFLKLDGSIDLQGESQLVQKKYGVYDTNFPYNFLTTQFDESILDATSSGYIERDQQGTSNLYNYNYWSSPVGAQNTTVNNMPFMLLNNKFDGTTASAPKPINWLAGGYNASPTNPISIPEYWLWSYENFISNTYSKWVKLYKNTQIKVGLGYSMKGSGTAKSYQNYTFIGKPNNNTITCPVTIGNDALIGNPYPSAIDARDFIKDNIPLKNPDGSISPANRVTSGSIDGTLYFWIHYTSNTTHILRDYQGGYATYNLSGGVPPVSSNLTTTDGYEISGAGSSNLIPGNYIPVAQGFFVHSADTYKLSDQIKFQNNQRVFYRETNDNSSDGSQFLKSSNSKNSKSSSTPTVDETAIKRLRLQIKTPEGIRRYLLLTFTPDNSASDGFDYGYDAKVFETLSNDILFMIDNEKFVIQGVGAFDDTKKYPIGIFLTTKGYVKISVSGLENMDENITVHIRDKFTGKTHNITHQPFEIELESGEYLDRFDLVFKMIKLVANDFTSGVFEVAPVVEDKNYHLFMNNASEELQIKNNGTDEIRSISLYNNLGQTIITWNKDLNRRIISLPVKLATGIYMVQINTIKGNINKRIIIE
jgi:hypothetical protein